MAIQSNIVEVTVTGTDRTAVKFRSTGREDGDPNAGKSVAKDSSGKVSGQVGSGTSIPGPTFSNPA